MAKWTVELGEHDISYRPRISIRGQILAYFITKKLEEGSPTMETVVVEEVSEPWILFTDGSSCLEGSRARLILTSPDGTKFTYALRFEFEASNNDAEYEALVAGLQIVEQIGVKNLPAKVQVEVLKDKSINEKEILAMVEEEGHTWMIPLFDYLTEGTLPMEPKKARGIKIKSRQYVVIGYVLYRISFLEPWLRCIIPLQAYYVVREIHEGSYNMHSGLRSLVAKGIRFAFVKYPQTNGLVERANQSLGEGIKARLDQGSRDWVEEVPHVLWAHRTMIKTGNKDTPFSLNYGMKAVIPVEIRMPSLRCAEVDQVQNDEALLFNLDMLEEKRERAAIREAKSKAKMERYYITKDRKTTFKAGDFVY
ncbi:reverse transcriptase domain-containing protein [Tanacetum coccineum]|uniref:Reverse transcriptase domain-containing protein n=1 Tax=Tanacetum coccineum TaxID=301880 RepID=A0ABQ5J0J4_9ASTR